jgi:butyrate kinase
VDPETGAQVNIREDGVLLIHYADGSSLIIFDDDTRINVQKLDHEQEESRTILTFFEKEGYSTVKITFDPVKARAQTMIGLGGADALMGRDGIMERSNGGLISEVHLPDRTVVQTYFEK